MQDQTISSTLDNEVCSIQTCATVCSDIGTSSPRKATLCTTALESDSKMILQFREKIIIISDWNYVGWVLSRIELTMTYTNTYKHTSKCNCLLQGTMHRAADRGLPTFQLCWAKPDPKCHAQHTTLMHTPYDW